MKFKTDENLPSEVAEQLRAAGHDAMTILDQDMQGDADPEVARVCQSEQRALVTLDLDFSDVRTYPPQDHHGLIVLRPRNQSKPSVLALVSQLIPLLDQEQLSGNLWILQEHGLRIREGDPGNDS